MKLVKSKMDVLAELSEAVIMYTERAKREGMLLIYDEPDLFVPVFGDRGKLRQVFINVIDNALKYSDPGDTTTVSARVEGNNIIIEVEDTGCGISRPSQDQDQILQGQSHPAWFGHWPGCGG